MPVKKAEYMPYELEDDVKCLPVRSKRYIHDRIHDGNNKDAHTVFKVFICLNFNVKWIKLCFSFHCQFNCHYSIQINLYFTRTFINLIIIYLESWTEDGNKSAYKIT